MSPYVWRLLTDWTPFVVFVGLLFYFMRSMQKKGGFGARQIEYMAFMQKYRSEHLEETRRIGNALHRIADALERSKLP